MCLQRINQAVNQLVMVSFFLASSSLSFSFSFFHDDGDGEWTGKRVAKSFCCLSRLFAVLLVSMSFELLGSYSCSPAAYRTGAAIDLRFLADWFTSLTESRADLFLIFFSSSFLLSFDSLLDAQRKGAPAAVPMCFGGGKNLVVTIDGVETAEEEELIYLCVCDAR